MITVIGSLKGGSGKSTLTFNLGVWLTMAGLKVQVVDADPQATLTDVTEVRDEEGYKPRLAVVNAESLTKGQLPEADETLIDIGTADMEAVTASLRTCDRVVVPVPPSQADVWSTQRFIKMVRGVEGRTTPPELLGFINRADTNPAIRETEEAAAALVSLANIQFIKRRLSQRTIFRRSFSEGLAVFELQATSKGAREFQALAAQLYPHVLR